MRLTNNRLFHRLYQKYLLTNKFSSLLYGDLVNYHQLAMQSIQIRLLLLPIMTLTFYDIHLGPMQTQTHLLVQSVKHV